MASAYFALRGVVHRATHFLWEKPYIDYKTHFWVKKQTTPEHETRFWKSLNAHGQRPVSYNCQSTYSGFMHLDFTSEDIIHKYVIHKYHLRQDWNQENNRSVDVALRHRISLQPWGVNCERTLVLGHPVRLGYLYRSTGTGIGRP